MFSYTSANCQLNALIDGILDTVNTASGGDNDVYDGINGVYYDVSDDEWRSDVLAAAVIVLLLMTIMMDICCRECDGEGQNIRDLYPTSDNCTYSKEIYLKLTAAVFPIKRVLG